ncbi:MAG: hypothetical protein H5T59_14140, partial [Anaerolineae bacterium]|nr:hypothetical protein [Anaerolineae bacterium]
MSQDKVFVEEDLLLDADKVIRNPDDDFYAEYLKPYYVLTADGQYLFASTQPGRMPSRAFYMVPEGYRLGKKQQPFAPGVEVGRRFYAVVKEYLKRARVIVMEGVQGEGGYRVGLRVVVSVQNPHAAYIAWMGKLMVFPPDPSVKISCWNYIVEERLPDDVVAEIHTFWPDYDPDLPITLYDLTEMDRDVRRV